MTISRTIRAALSAALAAAAACNGQRDNQSAAKTGEFPAVLATLDGDRVTMKDIEPRIAGDLARIEAQYRLIRSQIVEAALDSVLRDRTIGAEARRRGLTIDALVAAEAGAPVNPTDAEIAAWYNANQQRTGGRSLELLKPQIAELLRRERLNQAARHLEDRLMNERHVAVRLEPYRFSLDNRDAPVLGRNDAPVTLVEFSDFQCPILPAVRLDSQAGGEELSA
jgi:hypothetical protein